LRFSLLFLSVAVGVLEGIGISFILPILRVANNGGSSSDSSAILELFTAIYETLSIPLTMEYLILGVSAVIGVRYTLSFVRQYLLAIYKTDYLQTLRMDAFAATLGAETSYIDEKGSDEILNTVVTETREARTIVDRLFIEVDSIIISLVFASLALYIAPLLAIGIAVFWTSAIYGIRWLFPSGYSTGERVSAANERVQKNVQAGAQGIRDVKAFQINDRLIDEFRSTMDEYTGAVVGRIRDKSAVNQYTEFATAVTIFASMYAGLEVLGLTLSSLGVFLFALFRLGPRVSSLHNAIFQAEVRLPNLIDVRNYIDEAAGRQEHSGERPVQSPIDAITFEHVHFQYPSEDEKASDGVSFTIRKGEHVALVGPSGSGKSTIASLLIRLERPTGGTITADGTPISTYDLKPWRNRVAIVRQHPFIFNEPLR
jgi:subfamily B ATP-binding cassette protein MsbA